MNVELKKQDYRKNRKGDGKSLVAAMKMRHESTEDTIIKLVNEVARNYPNKKFDNYMTTNSAGFSMLQCECTEEEYNTFATIVDNIYPGMCVFNHD